MLVRQGVSGYGCYGEIMGAAQWKQRLGTDMRVCIKMINPKRVSNPRKTADPRSLCGGIETAQYTPTACAVATAAPRARGKNSGGRSKT